MDLPLDLAKPQSAVSALASFVRERLAEVGGALGPLLARRGEGESAPAGSENAHQAARQLAGVIVAAGPFAPTSYARARLLRQLHASGLLSDLEAEQVTEPFGVAR